MKTIEKSTRPTPPYSIDFEDYNHVEIVQVCWQELESSHHIFGDRLPVLQLRRVYEVFQCIAASQSLIFEHLAILDVQQGREPLHRESRLDV